MSLKKGDRIVLIKEVRREMNALDQKMVLKKGKIGVVTADQENYQVTMSIEFPITDTVSFVLHVCQDDLKKI